MKVKEIDRTANIAWSPAALHPIYMVAGTAAQQLDATFRYGKDFLLFETMVWIRIKLHIHCTELFHNYVPSLKMV